VNPKTTQRLIWGALAVALLVLGGLSVAKWSKTGKAPLEDFGAIPTFALTDQSNQPTSLDHFRGHIWVADLIFTRCTSICPMMTAKMFALQQALDANNDFGNVKLVSFSVDPTHDRPDTLLAYSAIHHADLRRWSFLTGPVPTIYTISKTGFHLALDSIGGEQTTPIIHSERFVLVDAKGHVRAYYDGSKDESRAKILEDIARLKEEQS
jgi:protein SCO1/2